MRRWWLAPGGGVALSVAAGLLAVGCAATAPVTGPSQAGHTTMAPATAKAQATAKAPATGPSPAATAARGAIGPARPDRVLVR